MTELEQNLLAIIQDAFPLEERPYRALAEQLGSDEQSVFAAVENLRNAGIIRRIGGVYDSKKLGYTSRLCTGKVPTVENGAKDDSALVNFAEVVDKIPAITHNYVRSHEYNVWFTVIGESEDVICKIVDEVCSKTSLYDVHILSATKKYKINTVMTQLPRQKNSNPVADRGLSRQNIENTESKDLSLMDRTRIHVACGDIPHTLTPYADWGVSVDGLREDLQQKRMRRFGTILRHQEAGFAYNAMVCFNLDVKNSAASQGQGNLAGKLLAAKPFISHCYERPAFEGFPYTLYAMMHAETAGDLDSHVKESADAIGCSEYVVLHSLRELKKTSFRFFAP